MCGHHRGTRQARQGAGARFASKQNRVRMRIRSARLCGAWLRKGSGGQWLAAASPSTLSATSDTARRSEIK